MCIDYLVRSVPPCANIDLLAFMIDMRLPRSPYAPNFIPCMYVANSHVYGSGGIVVFVRLLVWWEDRAKVS